MKTKDPTKYMIIMLTYCIAFSGGMSCESYWKKASGGDLSNDVSVRQVTPGGDHTATQQSSNASLIPSDDLPDTDRLADAIYRAEGGEKTRYPYGILTKYKVTTPRQACINTIEHAKRDYTDGDFIEFLGSRYCPVGAENDPDGLNKYWVKNVKYFYRKRK